MYSRLFPVILFTIPHSSSCKNRPLQPVVFKSQYGRFQKFVEFKTKLNWNPNFSTSRVTLNVVPRTYNHASFALLIPLSPSFTTLLPVWIKVFLQAKLWIALLWSLTKQNSSFYFYKASQSRDDPSSPLSSEKRQGEYVKASKQHRRRIINFIPWTFSPPSRPSIARVPFVSFPPSGPSASLSVVERYQECKRSFVDPG